jgi:hypothetical protein
MPALPETEYNPDEKYQHPQPENATRVLNESIPSIPTPAEAQQQYKENTKVNVQVPTSLIRWLCYSILFVILLLPFAFSWSLTMWEEVSVALILGHFSGQLNKLIDK